MSPTEPITGGCYCGAVRFESTKPPTRSAMCHCRMCQKWQGMAAGMGVFFDVESFSFTQGEPARFMTSKILERHYCAECGGSIGHRYKFGDAANIEIILIGTLDEPGEFDTPDFYFGVEDHLPGWITLVDDVPQIRADTSPQIAERFAEAERLGQGASNLDYRAMDELCFGDLFTGAKLEVADEIYSPTFVGHHPPKPNLEGPDAIKEQVRRTHTAYENVLYTIEDHLVRGSTTVTRWTMRGTSRRKRDEVGDSGESVLLSGLTMMRFHEGKMQEEWTYWSS